ncbi:hypothetical protein [Paucisalibacillus globulus]|uniref:hypothetical protein n=1 Tax=Paucisalibacillus globulus TaxID=351095 RepID=UPI000BB8E259|nr:hypothetical protein [Paucisalibacillus globulus]
MQNNIEYLHADKYGQAMKIARKFTGDGKTRPILSFVFHDKDGSIVATDSHRAIRIKNIHGFKEDYLIHPNTIDFAKADYPDTKKVFGEKGNISITLNKEQIKIWLQMHKSINQLIEKVYGRYTHVTLAFDEKITFKIKNENEIEFTLPYSDFDKPDTNKVTYDPKYMRDALEAHTTMGSEIVNIIINGQMRPMIIENGLDVEAVVLPVRTY